MHRLIFRIASKYKIGLLSNIYKGMLLLLIEKEIIPNIKYDQIIFSCDVRMMKPNPDIYALAQKKAEVYPKNILLVDDRQDYLDSASKAGWNAFLFDNKQKDVSVGELEKYLTRSSEAKPI